MCIMNYTMGFERPPTRAPTIEGIDLGRAYNRATKIIEASRIKEGQFVASHGEISVKNDLEKVKDFEGRHPGIDVNKALADIFEAEMIENGELSDWWGSSAVTYKTSKYDDYFNNVDMIIEFVEEEAEGSSFLGIAADVTFSRDIGNLSEKFETLLRKIRKGELPEVKYFHPKHPVLGDAPMFMPEVIIGANRLTVMEIANLSLKNDRKALANHRIQIMVLQQAEKQMGILARYAEIHGQKNIAIIYRGRLEIIQNILESKRDIAAKLAEHPAEPDEVNHGIMALAGRLERQMDHAEAA